MNNKPLNFDDLEKASNLLMNQEKLISEITIVPNGLISEGHPILLMHPNDFDKLKQSENERILNKRTN